MACNTCDATDVKGRRFFVGGNWKLNGSKESIKALVSAWAAETVDKTVGQLQLAHDDNHAHIMHAEIVISPPAIYLDFLRQTLPANYSTAVQNVYKVADGAFTGENRYQHRKLLLSAIAEQ